MYKILIKYKSTSNKTFWYEYEILENGETIVFSTDDIKKLKEEVEKIDQTIGSSNIRIINDISYDILINLDEFNVSTLEIATQEDVERIYESAFNEIFGEGGN